MPVDFTAALITVVQQAPRPSSIVQAVWLAFVIIFIVSVFATGFTAKRINNLHNPTYGKAFLAQILIGPFSLAGFMMFGLYLQAPPLVAFLIAYSIIPIVIYRIVFSCAMWREAGLIWIVVFLVQGAVGYGLVLAGILSLAAFTAA
ncbi:MAG: hypothetical protein AMS18_13090 [Gemmatimonas sp. SG8_17]|nr:MAG: hypothetical protein AMS18_13090 [Gemmatimonas sp. SG8_17]